MRLAFVIIITEVELKIQLYLVLARLLTIVAMEVGIVQLRWMEMYVAVARRKTTRMDGNSVMPQATLVVWPVTSHLTVRVRRLTAVGRVLYAIHTCAKNTFMIKEKIKMVKMRS